MIDLYYWPTPNGWKITIMLEECGLKYEVHPVDISRGEQFKPEFLAISPNNRIPAIVDRPDEGSGESISLFESGAILVYLAEKSGRFMPTDLRGRFDVLQWVFWQMANLGPMAGQLGHFRNYSEERLDYAIERYGKEYNRLIGVLNRQLDGREYICGDYSIADIACWPWMRSHERLGQPLDQFVHVQRWFDRVGARPAVERGLGIGAGLWTAGNLDDEARRRLFNQTAASVGEQAEEANRQEN
jgi:GST-like protein